MGKYVEIFPFVFFFFSFIAKEFHFSQCVHLCSLNYIKNTFYDSNIADFYERHMNYSERTVCNVCYMYSFSDKDINFLLYLAFRVRILRLYGIKATEFV